MAAAEAAFNVLLARIAKEAKERDEQATVDGGNGYAGMEEGEEDVATAMTRLLQADGNGDALPPELLRWAVHRFEGWVGGRLGEIAASEARTLYVHDLLCASMISSCPRTHQPALALFFLPCIDAARLLLHTGLYTQADSFYGHEGGHATRDFMPVGASACFVRHACISVSIPVGAYACLDMYTAPSQFSHKQSCASSILFHEPQPPLPPIF